MADMTLDDIAEAMKDIDFAMLTTRSKGGLTSRPMSNNRQVDYDGDSFYFSYEDSRKIADIRGDPMVALTFQADADASGEPPLFIGVAGRAELIRDRAVFAEHWTPDLEIWFDDGIDTPGMVLIKVHADTIRFWDGEDEGELRP